MLPWLTATGTLLSLFAFIRLRLKNGPPTTQYRPGRRSSVFCRQTIAFSVSGLLTTEDGRLTTAMVACRKSTLPIWQLDLASWR
jgi:hypothetical protein